jgi:hypothetical protein
MSNPSHLKPRRYLSEYLDGSFYIYDNRDGSYRKTEAKTTRDARREAQAMNVRGGYSVIY